MTFRRKPDAPRRDVAAEITNLIIEKLEAGVLPWSRPWGLTGAGGRPLRHCGTPYTGINTLYLWAIGDARGYKSRTWMTYRQAEELGGQVRRGERGSLSVYFSSFSKTETDRVTGTEATKNIRFLRSYIVFNVDQIDGLPTYYYPTVAPPQPRVESEHRASIDAFFGALPGTVRHGGDQAYFSPIGDYIQMPNRGAFRSDDHYASTLSDTIEPPCEAENGWADSITLNATLSHAGASVEVACDADVAFGTSSEFYYPAMDTAVFVRRGCDVSALDVADLLESAAFSANEDSDADSYDTQQERFQRDAAQRMVRLLEGQDAALERRLRDLLSGYSLLVPDDRAVTITVTSGELTIAITPMLADAS